MEKTEDERMAVHKRKEAEQDDQEQKSTPSPPFLVGPPKPKKRSRLLKFEKLYLNYLPTADMYEWSYMHR